MLDQRTAEYLEHKAGSHGTDKLVEFSLRGRGHEGTCELRLLLEYDQGTRTMYPSSDLAVSIGEECRLSVS